MTTPPTDTPAGWTSVDTDNPADRPRTPIAEEINILAGAGLYQLAGNDLVAVHEILQEIEDLSAQLHRLGDLVTALQWAADWIDDMASPDPDTTEALAEIRNLLAANPAGL